jgi:hypothetical protein
MTIGDPQSFNRYAYVNNDPMNQTDPLGLKAGLNYYYREADLSWGDVSNSFWGRPDISTVARRDVGMAHIARGMWRHDTLMSTPVEDESDDEAATAHAQSEETATPGALKVISVDVLPVCDGQNCGGSPAAPFGIKVAITYQVVDAAGAEIRQPGLVPMEKVGATRIETQAKIEFERGREGTIGPNPKRNSLNTGVTDTNGRFVDAPFGNTRDKHFVKSTVQQKIYFKFGKQKVYVRTNDIIITGAQDRKNKVLTYTITNGSDINASISMRY